MMIAVYHLVLLADSMPRVNHVVNFSFETVDPANSNLAVGWRSYGAPYTRVHNFHVWDQNYVAEMKAGQGAVQRIVLNQTTPYPVRISARVKGENIANDPADKFGASLGCMVKYVNIVDPAWCPTTMTTKNVGTFDWKCVGYNTGTLNTSSVWNRIEWIDVRLSMGNVLGTAWFDDVHVEEYTRGPGMVTFNFHDSFLSTYTKGYPLLKASGYVGSVAAVTGYIDSTDGKHMTLAQHKELYNNGWSITSHGVTHRDLTTLSINEVNDELYWSHKYLVDNEMPTKHFVLPFFSYNAAVISRIQAEWYGGYPYLSAQTDKDFNQQGTFPYNIGVKTIKHDTQMSEINAWVDMAKGTGNWTIFVIHEIDNANGIWTMTSGMLEQMIARVKSEGVEVVSYDEGFNRITKLQ
jgi:peptidoglycan/xylan/chitin deacetylase (PgdA/CDA1 family)